MSSSEANRIKTGQTIESIRMDHAKRGDILVRPAISSQHGQATNTDKLMNQAICAYKSPISHFNVTAEQCAISEDYIISKHAVVGDVTVRHKKTVIPYMCYRSFLCTSMNRHSLTKGAAVTDVHISFAPGESQILRGITQNHSGMYSAFLSQNR